MLFLALLYNKSFFKLELPKRGGKEREEKELDGAKVTETISVSSTDNTQEKPVAEKRGRGKPAKIVEEKKAPEVEELPAKKGRSRKNQVEEESVQETLPTKKRGRQAKVTEEKTEPESEKLATPKRGGIRKAATEEPEQPVPKKGRGRQVKQVESVPEKSPAPAKSPPARRNVTKHVTIVTPSTMSTANSKQKKTEEQPVATKRSTRARK